MVGDGQRVQAQPHRLLDELGRRAGAVEEAEVAVAVQLGVRRHAVGPRDRAGLGGPALAARDRRVVGAREPAEARLELLPLHRGVVPAHQSPPISRSPPRATSPAARRPAATRGRRRRRPGSAPTAPRHPTTTLSSTGHGPAHDVTGCHGRRGPSPAPSRKRGGSPVTAPRSVTQHRATGVVDDLGRRRGREDPHRCRARHPPGPGPVDRAQVDGPLAPRHQRLAGRRAAPALQHRSAHGVEADHPLHPGHAPLDEVVGRPAPQRLAVGGGRLDHLGHEPHPLDRGPHRRRRPCASAARTRTGASRRTAAASGPGRRGRAGRSGAGAARCAREQTTARRTRPRSAPRWRRAGGAASSVEEALGGGAHAERHRLDRVERRLEAPPRPRARAAGCARRTAPGPRRGRAATPRRRSGRGGARPPRPAARRGRRGCVRPEALQEADHLAPLGAVALEHVRPAASAGTPPSRPAARPPSPAPRRCARPARR